MENSSETIKVIRDFSSHCNLFLVGRVPQSMVAVSLNVEVKKHMALECLEKRDHR